MSLEVKINDEIKEAMKSGNKDRLETLRSIRAGILEFAKSGIGREMNNDDEIKLLNNLVKKRKDAIEMYSKGGREELANKESFELSVLMEFMPAQMSEEEIENVINKLIADNNAEGAKDVGKIIGLSMKELKGKADGSIVQKIVKEKLSGENN